MVTRVTPVRTYLVVFAALIVLTALTVAASRLHIGVWHTPLALGIAGCKAVQLSIWFWAGVSKLTVAFGYVIPVMTVNNPLVQSATVRRRMFMSYPDDFAPSRLGRSMAHAGTFLEFAAPLTLLFVSEPGPLLVLGMIFALALHGFILGNMPAGAVFEWNLVSLYAAFFLFVGYPTITVFDISPSLPGRGIRLPRP